MSGPPLCASTSGSRDDGRTRQARCRTSQRARIAPAREIAPRRHAYGPFTCEARNAAARIALRATRSRDIRCRRNRGSSAARWIWRAAPSRSPGRRWPAARCELDCSAPTIALPASDGQRECGLRALLEPIPRDAAARIVLTSRVRRRFGLEFGLRLARTRQPIAGMPMASKTRPSDTRRIPGSRPVEVRCASPPRTFAHCPASAPTPRHATSHGASAACTRCARFSRLPRNAPSGRPAGCD